MSNRTVITLTTDFGYTDSFVGAMKGVILRINPDVEIIDLTHGIRPQDIRDAAFTIGMNYGYFPDKTIHVVVVDPGVGSMRRPIIAMSDHQYFIGPDNGVFSKVYSMKKEILEVIHITASHYFLSSHSPTFHGRDIFAPVAAWLSRGINISKFGDIITDFNTISLPCTEKSSEGSLRGEVIQIDRFGNAISNILKSDIDNICDNGPDNGIKVLINGNEISRKQFYSEADEGNLYSLINSNGFLEFFVNRGNASQQYKIGIGDIAEVIVIKNPA